MARFAKTLMVVMMSTTLFAANIAEAKRVGGGRSGGMQRQAAPAPQRNNNVQQQPQQQPMAPAQKSGGMGMMGGVLGGLAAGSLLGYMFGSNNASGAAQGESGVPWGTLLLLGALTAGGVMWMRRRKQAQVAQQSNGMAYAGASAAPAPLFPQPQSAQPAQQDRVFRIGEGAGSAAPAATGGLFGGGAAAQQQSSPITRLPDGTEVAAFLRQARASFMHMQSLNSPSQAEEMRRYMTPELFADLKDEIGSNTDVAEFPELNLNVLEAVNESGRMIASVEFTGRVSESLHAAPVPFREIWHFVRPIGSDPRWLLAGIQQA
ncbi:39S ribosomal protein L45 [Deefgea tanakiae]|uniref:39S ribosomal protein L45 n=1 Tax=Deefgea tanakiae TaxID=2865840 RepID=A0ABX8Z798_9NEIS|nr:Tim44-like domain-containing protein [Deefgea tanakiae]QZA78457.1 39S ribosomal protein L45 [Deefgea tanakiae]